MPGPFLFGSGFVKVAGKTLLKETVKQTPRVARTVMAPVRYAAGSGKEFTRGLLQGSPKVVRLSPDGPATTATIYNSTRVGMQVRSATYEAAKLAFVKAPKLAFAVARFEARMHVRDFLSYPNAAALTYKMSRAGGELAGKANLAQRALDAGVARYASATNKFAVGPTFKGAAGDLARQAIYVGAGAAIVHGRALIGKAQGLLDNLTARLDNLQGQIPVPATPPARVDEQSTPPPIVITAPTRTDTRPTQPVLIPPPRISAPAEPGRGQFK